ncbi:MAG TPA: SRPBCC family protein [Chitinophagaceae bacterium]|jgi:ligand-binding SRPBCC domain-containing protein|nr:SRPBCC family protein [Chitinophagaceae bacterium]
MIHLTTFIAAPAGRVFDLSRSIDLHKASMNRFGEAAVAGTITGLINEGETVTWQARHLGKVRTLEVKITKMERPHFFIDEMVRGDFRSMKHEHYVKPVENGCFLIDQFRIELPYGWAGRLFGALYLNGYMERLLARRNEVIKSVAESGQWRHFLER